MPAENFLKSIILQVSVPVLSLKTYLTYPSSSFKLLDWTLVSISFSKQKISVSQQIKNDWKNLTSSSVTISEIGTILVNSNSQVPNEVIIDVNQYLVVQSSDAPEILSKSR